MLSEKELLIPGETVMGRYNAEVAHWAGDRYVPFVMPLMMLITNRRVILQPQKRKHYEPASIPGRYIRQVEEIKTPKQGFTLTLQDGRRISLFVGWGRGSDPISSIRIIAALPPNRDYSLPLSLDHLQKLIDFVEAL